MDRELQVCAVEYILALTVSSQKQPDRYRIECATYASEAEELGVAFDMTEDKLPPRAPREECLLARRVFGIYLASRASSWESWSSGR